MNGESQARSYSGGGDSVSSGGCSSGSSKSLYGLDWGKEGEDRWVE